MLGCSFLTVIFFPALLTINLGVVIPLALSCLVLVVVIPSAAWRGKLSVPAYALILFAAAFVAYGIGRLAGAQSIHGTTLGIVISFIFFLLVAAAVGSFLGIFFYRQPVDNSTASPSEPSVSSAVPAMEEDRR
ncbi:MAG: hypothetical protein EPN47_08415 [Acidobacteria bacterium]|nr:MAG: hypothetical protein EPN47_08415 [Acidobacteriota bacterium]